MKFLSCENRRCALAMFVLLYSFLHASAQTGGPLGASPPASGTPKVEFEKYSLPNGIQVILHVDRKLPIVHVNQWFHVGSKDERPGRTGFAHLFEHMMFQGSKNLPGEYFTHVEKAGANLITGANGSTNSDRTNYYATVPSANLEYLLWIESDRLATLADALTKETLDNQRNVVKNERRQRYENQPYGHAFKLIDENLHPTGHPYSWDGIGSHEDLTAATLDDLKEFFKTYYAPNNLSLVIAGDFDPAEAKRLVEKYFAGIPPGPPLARPKRWVAKLEGEKLVEVKDRVPQERVYINWPTPALFDAGDAELDLAATIMTDGLSARLNKTLVYDRQLATSVTANQASRELSSIFTVTATARAGSQLSQIEQIVTDEIARLAKEGPTAEELRRAQSKWEYRFVSDLERLGGRGGRGDLLNSYNTFWGDPGKFEDDFARYRNATAQSVRDAVAKWLDTRNRLVVRYRTETAGRESQTALDRSKPPPIGDDRRFVAPEVKSARLENGMEVFVAVRRDLPKVAVSLVTKSGPVADPRGKAGVALLMYRTITRGTRTRSALQVVDELGDLGTSLTGSVARESTQLTMEVLKRNLAPAMTVFTDVVRNPTFPTEEVERERKKHLDTLAQEATNADYVSVHVINMLMYGHEHPYGRPNGGLPGTVARITREDLTEFHQTYWKPGGSALVFTGDITLAEATEIARQHFGSWAGGAPPAVNIPAPQPVAAGKVFLIDRQDSAQTVISQMLPGPPRKTEDYYALILADTAWGGLSMSRLYMNLRESKGYTYGAWSYPELMSKSGIWVAFASVQTDKTKESVVEFVSELKMLAGEKPITETELADVKANRVRGYAQEFETLAQLAGKIASLWAGGLPINELQRQPDELQALTHSDVNAVARKYAVPDKAILLLVGDLSKIEVGVRELNLGEVIVLDAEGKLVSKK
ncbi:MAG: insulinase family protein [Rubrivivax sp.]|nr:insulinase family protein [Pyrinomonadaceae bacterium]